MNNSEISGIDRQALAGLTRDYVVTLWSPEAAELFAISDAVGTAVAELERWDMPAAQRAVISRMCLGDFWSFHVNVPDSGGPARPLRVSISVAADPRGRDEILFSWTPASNERTPRLARSREVIWGASLAGPFALTEVYDERMFTQYCSPAIRTRLGLRARDLVGVPSIESIHPDDRLLWQFAADAAGADSSRSHYVEVRRRYFGEGWRLVGTELTNQLNHPDIGGIVGNSHEITALADSASDYIGTRQLALVRSELASESEPPSPSQTDALIAKLTRRETIVVSRLLDGDRVPEIAKGLFVSQSTVRNQLASVFRKADVSSQQELLILLRRSFPPASGRSIARSARDGLPIAARRR